MLTTLIRRSCLGHNLCAVTGLYIAKRLVVFAILSFEEIIGTLLKLLAAFRDAATAAATARLGARTTARLRTRAGTTSHGLNRGDLHSRRRELNSGLRRSSPG